MNSVIFDVLVKTLRPFFILVAVWFLLRSHDAPGGGFVAGLLLASATLLQVLSKGWFSLKKFHREYLFEIMGAGILVAIASGLFALILGNPYMTARWIRLSYFEYGSPMLFDLGILLVVYSSIVICIGFLLSEDEIDSGGAT